MEETQNFKELVKDHGFYNKESQYRILRGADRGPDKSLNLDPMTKRAWMKIEMDADNDESYQLYLSLLDKIDYRVFDKYTKEEGIGSYEVFKKNKIKSGAKLFKFLRKKQILKPTDIEAVTTKRNTEQLWLCISQNPIDFLFCSSNQSYTTCLDINSDYEGAFYMGLLGLSVDKNRFIAFSTKDKKGFKSELFSKEYTQHKIVSRCWGLLGKKGTFVLERYYPFKTVGFAKDIESYTELEYIKTSGEKFRSWVSKYSVRKVKDIKNHTRWIYIDTIGATGIKFDYINHEEDFFRYKYGGTSGNISTFEYNYNLGLTKLTNFSYLETGVQICGVCGEYYGTNEGGEVQGKGHCCPTCLKGYRYCHHCCFYVKKDLLNTKINSGNMVCDVCKDQYKKCSCCDELFYKGALHDGNTLCQKCITELKKKCNRCGKYVDKDKHAEQDGFCDDCYQMVQEKEHSNVIKDMLLCSRLKEGMKLELRSKFERFYNDPNINDSMAEYLGQRVTFDKLSYGETYIQIKEDGGRYNWDTRWFKDYEEEYHQPCMREILRDDLEYRIIEDSWAVIRGV